MIDRGLEEVVRVTVQSDGVTGELALAIEPGTRADAQRKAIDRILAEPLGEAAAELNLVLAARPSSFAFGMPGKDGEGRTRFIVRGRREGDRLVPAPTAPAERESTKGRRRA